MTVPVKSLAQECLHRCDVIASCTDIPGQITRTYLTPAMKLAHRHLRFWMESTGLCVRVDHAGNLIGRLAGAGGTSKTLLIGSHLDTVPNAGRYDGVLGVMIGLAVAQAIQASGEALPFSIDVVGFSEEEGVRFATPYFGSRAIAGSFDPAWLALLDDAGNTLQSVIEAFGLQPGQMESSAYAVEDVIGFVEPHIEQGPVLQDAGLPIGIVQTIVGQSRCRVSFRGKSGHAGTTPMELRQDALVPAARWIAAVNDYAKSVDGLRCTVGTAGVFPGARNVIPDRVVLSMDVRHADNDIREVAIINLFKWAAELARQGNVTFEILETQSQTASRMQPEITQRLREAVLEAGHRDFTLSSGAGHDAVVMSEVFPTTMLFLRQASGISHHPDEDVYEGDVAIAIDVLTRLVLSLR